MKKALIVLLACVFVATLVLAVACNNHNWDEEWSSDATNHWHECLDGDGEISDKAAHVDANNDGKCDVCQRTLSTNPPVGGDEDSVTLYYYNTDGWTDVYAYAYDVTEAEPVGEWPGTKTTADTRTDWVKVTVDVNPVTDDFNVIFNNGDDEQSASLYISNTTNVYLVNKENGTYSSYTAAEEAMNGTQPGGKTYTVYVYAPTWSTVALHAYYVPENESDGVPLTGGWGTAVMTDDGDGWYKYDVPCDEDIFTTRGINVIFFDKDNDTQDNEVRYSGWTDNAEWVYWNVTKGAEDKFNSKETALASGTDTPTPSGDQVIVHVHKKDGWTGELNLYAYYGSPATQPLGGWPGKAMDADTENDGWYKVTITFAGEKPANYNVIVNGGSNAQYDMAINLSESEIWINYKEHVFATKDDAVNDEALEVTPPDDSVIDVTIHVKMPTGWTDMAVYIWGNGTNSDMLGGWPGLACGAEKDAFNEHAKWSYDESTQWLTIKIALRSKTDTANVIINNNNNGKQTVSIPVTPSTGEIWVTVLDTQSTGTDYDVEKDTSNPDAVAASVIALLPVRIKEYAFAA